MAKMKRKSKRKPARKKWPSEMAMCQALIDTARGSGWLAQPETAGYDLVLVSPDGLRIGVEAKLNANVAVLTQAWLRSKNDTQTHVTMVYVPVGRGDFEILCDGLGLGMHEAGEPGGLLQTIGPTIAMEYLRADCSRAKKRTPTKDLPLLHVPSAVAGAAAPRKLTEWKLKAVKFCLDNTGSKAITRQGLTDAGLSPGLWIRNWLKPCGRGPGKSGRSVQLYEFKDHPGRPDVRYPEIAEAMTAHAGGSDA